MSEKIIKKGYELNLQKIHEGYLYGSYTVLAENIGKAKKLMLDKVLADGLTLNTGEDVSFINMPILRNNHFDIVEFEGKEVKRHEIEQILQDREKEAEWQNILNDRLITHCYITKGSYYRPNYCGYTDFKSRAGVYPKQDAINHCKGCRDLRIIPINTVEHNNLILTEITDLQTRLIQ